MSEMRPPAAADGTTGSEGASPASEADDSAETARARKRAAMNAWREQNKDHVREYNRRWNAEHPDRVRELNRESARRATQRQRQVRERKERDRRYYIDNAERIRENSRAWRAARAAEDPEGFRQARSAQRREWWKRRPRELRERDALAARDRGDAPAARERSRAYYQRNADRINAAKREHLREHPEKRREYQQRWREKERARKAAGLPPRTLHRTTPAERAANRTAADAFFTKVYPASQIQQMRNGPPTPPELLAQWNRESRRARATHLLAEQTELRDRLVNEMPPADRAAKMAEEREQARLDAIGRAVNDRLRHRDPPRQPHHLDPAAPHPMLQHPNGTGLHR